MGIIFGILLTELKLFGVSLRSPLLSFLTLGPKFWPKIFLFLSVFGIYAYQFSNVDDILSLSKLNILTFTIVCFGACLLFTLSVSESFSQQPTLNAVKVVPIFFLLITFLQLLQLSFWEEYFSEISRSIYPRSTGLSAEPSFFANMLFYFFILYQGCVGNSKAITCIFFILSISTWSMTLVVFLIVLALILFAFRLRYGKLKVTPLFLIIVFPLLFLLADQVYFILANESLAFFLYKATGSWREISMYSSIYGADLIGPFSGGIKWQDIIQDGQKIIGQGSVVEYWLIWPWSLFSMLLCEFGLLPTFLIIFLVGRKLNHFWNKKPYLRPRLKWFTASFIIGFFLAPKWCVYFLFFPLIFKTDKKQYVPAQ